MSPSRFLAASSIVVIILSTLSGLTAAQPRALAAPEAPAAPFTAAFSYQGDLLLAGVPAEGSYDFQFTLYATGSGGGPVGSTLSLPGVAVSKGIFTVQLDFGAAAFDGQARWLEVAVRPAGGGGYTTLAPRHPLTATPYALYSSTAGSAGSAASAAWSGLTGVPAGFADGVDNDTTYSAGYGLALVGTVFEADIGALQARILGTCAPGSSIREVFANGGVACEPDDTGSASSGWSLTGNSGTSAGANFLGTTDFQALEFKVNGQRVLRLEPPIATYWGFAPNLIAGHPGNSVAANQVGQTIAGGGSDVPICGLYGSTPCLNNVTGDFGVIGGGYGNTANGPGTVDGGFKNSAGWAAAVGGGEGNRADGSHAAISGGYGNSAGGQFATVGGGASNVAGYLGATIAGGGYNSATGSYATAAGGWLNSAGGDYSFAAGRRAKADAHGAFVWADSTDADFSAAYPNSFNVRSAGGAYIIAKSTAGYGLWVDNLTDESYTDNGDGIRSYAGVSRGYNWAAVYAHNVGTSPALFAHSNGTYAGYFEGGIYVSGGCYGCTVVYLAANRGSETLAPGDVVSADGVGAPLSAKAPPVLKVRRATSGAVGVVAGRAQVVESTKNGQTLVSPEMADGPIAAGDHLFIVVSGLAQARVDARTAPVRPGQRLTAAGQAGSARSLRTASVDGIEVAEAAPVLGVALEELVAGEGMIWVLVSIQ